MKFEFLKLLCACFDEIKALHFAPQWTTFLIERNILTLNNCKLCKFFLVHKLSNKILQELCKEPKSSKKIKMELKLFNNLKLFKNFGIIKNY